MVDGYLIAWSVYLLAGVGCCVIWWHITAHLDNAGWRDLLRGLVAVLLFTPWYAGEAQQELAPAFFVLLMDVFLKGTEGGLQGGIVLLIALFVMLLGLTGQMLFRHRASRR